MTEMNVAEQAIADALLKIRGVEEVHTRIIDGIPVMIARCTRAGTTKYIGGILTLDLDDTARALDIAFSEPEALG